MSVLLRTFIIVMLLLLVFLLPFSASAVQTNTIDFTLLDSVITKQMEKHGLPGVALAVFENGEITYLKGYGTAGNGQRMTAQTQMFIGSQSKSFTALAIAQLADQGKIDLYSPVQKYIPWFRVADDTASQNITIDQLLHHTSGLSDSGLTGLLPNDTSLEQAVRSLSTARLTAPVGSTHQYFNLGYSILTYVVEEVSGQSYPDYVQEKIMTPLGMTSSTAKPEFAANLAQGYSRLFGFAIPMRQPVPAYAVGQGFIVSTAEDLARYALAFEVKDQDLLSAQMMKKVLTPGIGSYGMGWHIADNGTKIFHGGANETFRTEVNLYPLRNRGFVLLTNEGYQVDHFISAAQLTSSVEAVILSKSLEGLDKGWSVKWMGWILGFFVIALLTLHTYNFLMLRTWVKRTERLITLKRVFDVCVSFIIPTLILLGVFFGIKQFYGNRFNLLLNLAYLPKVLPDVFILMLVGSVPDYLQGIIKIILWQKSRLLTSVS